MIAIGTVSATENVTDVVVGVEETNDVLNIENNQNGDFHNSDEIDYKLSVSESDKLNYALDDGSFKDLSNEISNATNELNLSRNYVFDSSDSANVIVIDKPIVINGNGHNIIAESKTSVFSITANNVILKNINFYDSTGACIYWQASNGTLINCKFENCINDGNGGAIYWRIGKNGLISNCTFKKCSSTSHDGGALYLDNSFLKIENTKFIDNSASMSFNGGGAIYLDTGGLNINNCTFDHNTGSSGGAIRGFSYSACNITNSKFYNNSNLAITWYGNNLEINNCSFIDNTNNANRYFGPYGPINSAGTMNAMGGAVVITGNYTRILNSVFNNNKLSATIHSTVDKYKDPTFNQWNYYNIRETFHINAYGGAIALKGNKFYLDNISCENNLAYSAGKVDIEYTSITYSMTGINMYQYIYANSYGGAIYLNGGGILSNAFISENKLDGHAEVNRGIVSASTCPTICDVKGYGAGVYWDGYSRNNLVNNSVFIQNSLSSDQTGSALYLNNFKGDVNFNIFLQNPDKIIDSSSSEISADYNWWGNTQSNFNQQLFTDDLGTTKWLFLNMSSNKSNLEIGDKAIVTLDLSNVYDSSTNNIGHTYEISNIDFNLLSNKIKTNVSNAIINNGITNIEIVAQNYGQGSLTASYNGISSTLTFTISKKTSQVKSQINNCSIYNDKLMAYLNVTPNATGTLKVYLNNNLHSSIALNGKNEFNIDLTGLSANNYTLYASYDGDDNYSSSSSTINFEIKKAHNTIQISNPYTIDYGDVITLDVDKGNVTDGTLLVQINNGNALVYNQTYNIIDINKITLPMLDAGDYSLLINYESNNYYGSSFNSTFTVNKLNPITNKRIINTIYGKSEILFTSSVDGVLKINIQNKLYKTFNIKSNTDNSLNMSDLDAGDYEIEYVFAPNNQNYNNATSKTTLTIFKSEPTFDIVITDINYKESANLNINYLNDVTGIANITISNKEGYEIKYQKVALSGSNINKILSNLNASKYTITFEYGGNNNYYPTTVSKTFNVLKIDPVMIVDVTNAVYGQTAKITVNSNAGGNITLKIGSVKTYTDLQITDNRVVQNINDLNAGTYDVKVTYNGNNNYNTKTEYAKLTITKLSSNVVATVDDITYPQDTVINVKASVNGTVGVTIVGHYTKYVNVVANTITPIAIENIPVGKHNVSVKLTPSNTNYNESAYNTDYTVSKKETTVDLDIANSVYGEEVIVNVTASEDGKVILKIGDITKEKNVFANTLTKINLGVLAANSYDVSVSFDAGDNYKPSNGQGNIVVSPAEAKITEIQSNNNIYGENTIIKVKTNVAGTLNIKCDSIEKTFNVDANKLASLDLGILDVGSKNIEITLNAGSNYTKPTRNAEITVTPKSTTVNLNVKNSIYGEKVIVNVSASETGKISIQLGDIIKHADVIANKVTSVDFGILDAKSYAVNVTFNAGNNYKESYNSASLIVSPIQSKITETYAQDNIYGENTVIKVKTNVDGSLTVKLGENTKVIEVIANQLASVDFGILDANTYDVKMNLNVGNNYISATNSTKITISPKSVLLKLDVADSTYGNNVVVNVSASENGKITVKLGDIVKNVDVNANKLTSIDFGNLNSGKYNISANFDAGNNYLSSQKDASITINPKNTSVTLKVKEYEINEHVVVNVTASENGKMTITLNNMIKNIDVIANMATSVDFGVLNSGSYYVVANFAAGNNYVNSTDTENIKVLAKIDEKDINISVPEIKANQENNIVINLPADATGTITLTIGNNSYTFTVKNGVANIKVPKLDDGNYDYKINYSGDSKYSSFENTGSIDVEKPTPEIVVPPLDKPSADGSIDINLPNDATGTVTFVIDKKPYSFPVVNGVAKVYLPDLNNGDYDYTITYSGDGKYSAFTNTGNVKISKISATVLIVPEVNTVYNSNGYIEVTLNDENGNGVGDAPLEVSLNGKNYISRTDENGQAKFTTNSLAPKVYTAIVTFAGNSNYAKSVKALKVTVKKATVKLTAKAKTFKVSAKTKKYTVTLKTNRNKVMKNTKVTIKVNKKTYTAKTNAKGVATFKLTKLTKKGKYTANVKYAGSKYYNAKSVNVKITIK